MSHHHAHEHKHEHKGKSSDGFVDKVAVLKALDVKEGQIVLDAGCGNGYMAKELAGLVKSNGKVYAMDADESAIENLKKTAVTDAIQPIIGDITATTELRDLSLDLIYLSVVMHGFSESQTAGFIAEVQRLLKPGGILAVLEFKKEDTSHGPPMEIRLSPEEMKGKIPFTLVKRVAIGEDLYLQLFQK